LNTLSSSAVRTLVVAMAGFLTVAGAAAAHETTDKGASETAESEDAHSHDHDHDHAGGSVHVHGLANASIAVDGDTLSIGIDTALASIGSSERQPEDEASREAMSAALTPFADPFHVVSLPDAADCAPGEADVGTDYSGGPGNLVADYTLTCGDISAVTDVDFVLFSHYAGTLETIEAVWIDEASQSSATLTPDSRTISPN